MTEFIQGIDKKALFVALALLMVVSRPCPMSGIVHLADASNAIFFLAGLWMLPRLAFVGLVLLAGGLDFVSIQVFGTSAFCVSPAYGFLLPAYALLWFGGRFFAERAVTMMRSASVIAVFCGLQSVAWLLTSGSFWFLSGRFPTPDVAGFFAHSGQYYTGYLLGGLWYVLFFVLAGHAVHQLSARRGEMV